MSNYIIEKMKSEAAAENKAILTNAKKEAQDRINRAKAEIEKATQSQKERAKRLSEQDHKIQEIIDQVAIRRHSIVYRQKAIDEVFALVEKQLRGMSTSDKTKLANGLKKKYATATDTVTNVDGGIVIENKSYVRSLTLKELLAHLREETELQVANILFAE